MQKNKHCIKINLFHSIFISTQFSFILFVKKTLNIIIERPKETRLLPSNILTRMQDMGEMYDRNMLIIVFMLVLVRDHTREFLEKRFIFLSAKEE
jgi:hypothetical protein